MSKPRAGDRPPSIPKLLDRLRRSELLDEDQRRETELLAGKYKDSRELAEELIIRGFITRWQSEEVMRGRTNFCIDRYRLVAKVGSGGMGSVYKAVHRDLDRVVAVKLMSPSLVENEQQVLRFRREMKATARLTHPNIIVTFDAGAADNVPFLVMEYIDGENLESMARRVENFPIGFVCECMRQTALGLQHAHEHGLVHRDIKPGNLLMTNADPPIVKILDMGLSRFVSDGEADKVDAGLTQTGQVVGTPTYIAPEQIEDTRSADIRADIYSLGAAFFRMLTGRPPFQAKSSQVLFMMKRTKPAPPVRTFRPEISAEIEAIIAKMLERSPSNRYQTPNEVAAALAPFCSVAERSPELTVAPDPVFNEEAAKDEEDALNESSDLSEAVDAMASAATEVAAGSSVSLQDQERSLLSDLIRLARERGAAESNSRTEVNTRTAAVERDYLEKTQAIQERFKIATAKVQKRFDDVQQRIPEAYAKEKALIVHERQVSRTRIMTKLQSEKEEAEKDYKAAKWETKTVYDASKEGAKQTLAETKNALVECQQRVDGIIADAKKEWRSWGRKENFVASALGEPLPETEDLLGWLRLQIDAASESVAKMKTLVIPRVFTDRRIVLLSFLVLVSLVYPLIVNFEWKQALGIDLAASVVFGLFVRWQVRLYMNRKAKPVRLQLGLLRDQMAGTDRMVRDAASRLYEETRAAIKKRFEDDTKAEEQKHRERMTQIHSRSEADAAASEERYSRRYSANKEKRNRHLAKAREKYPSLLAQLRQKYELDIRSLTDRKDRMIHECKTRFNNQWRSLTNQWRWGINSIRERLHNVERENYRTFAAWNDPLWDGKPWPTGEEPSRTPTAIRFGELQVDVSKIPNGIPTDEKLRGLGIARFTLPAFLRFPEGASMMIRAEGVGREVADQTLAAVMLRMLVAIPPGKVRFTILDPVGLGRHFAGFMHLADFDPLLVSNRIWSESAFIDQRLADMTAHMENVLQKYLRNEFASIEEYNKDAGEIAEPFRVLVMAGFPATLTENATRRLMSIIAGGPRCGVHVLMSVDTSLPMPSGIRLADIEPHCVNLQYSDGRFVWIDPEFEPLPLTVEAPPTPERSTALIRQLGERAKAASRVEVPFSRIIPAESDWWTGDTRSDVRVALGPAGANKRQFLELGRGTSQHVLIAGRTGSGKSTLLHVLITNLALIYSPDEIEFYLIDFKKGVEFKAYASHSLPHARVVAIESEREFGLSVMQRLDQELIRRGEMYRDLGVQDVAGFRRANPDTPMPRILLVVDEFQELFVEDDRIAQDSALMLDRLVRQGRAFGIHVLLGSQTLGGAYTLARSTIGQMAIRIALQCSENDALLILSDSNSAARLLSRPGEAIYNDANGLVEGNHPFQIAWINDDVRDEYLQKVDALRTSKPPKRRLTQIVFEGSSPANIEKNYLLQDLLDLPAWPTGPRAISAWLGDAIAIKDPTMASFRRLGGENVLLIGQQPESAAAMFAGAIAALAAQIPPPAPGSLPTFLVLDGSPIDSPLAGFFPGLTEVFPQGMRVSGWRDALKTVADVAAEVERRLADRRTDAPEIHFFIFDVQRFRDVRKSDDDFGFSRSDSGPSPAQQLVNILREGPGFGVHTWLWADSLANVQRTFERPTLREFALRVLFSMSAADSSVLIDSPAASRLGANRALFIHEDEGRTEKFRPYGLASLEWFAKIRERLQQRPAIAVDASAPLTSEAANGTPAETENSSANGNVDDSGSNLESSWTGADDQLAT